MQKIKDFIKNILEINNLQAFALSLGVMILVVLGFRGEFNLYTLAILVSIFILIVAYSKLGGVVIQILMSTFAVLYATSIYTYLVSELNQYVIQPFFLTIACTTCFLALTYSSYQANLRNRRFWAAFITIVNVSIKMGLMLARTSYFLTELAGVFITIIFILLWSIWIENSNKTKINKPNYEEERKDEKYLYLYIDEEINLSNNTWLENNKNAYPYIYEKLMRAKETKLTLIIISMVKVDKTYDLQYVKYNRELIPYLYVNGKSDKYLSDIINQFQFEISK